MLTSKILLIFSSYFIYKFSSYFISFLNNGFPSWDDKFNIGNASYSLFFAPYGAILGIVIVSPLFYISIKNIYNHSISNETGLAKIVKIEPSTPDNDKGTPINITVILNNTEVTYDFTINNYQEIYSVGDMIPVRYKSGMERNSVLDEKTIDLKYKQYKSNQ
jgi:hypothetical protein